MADLTPSPLGQVSSRLFGYIFSLYAIGWFWGLLGVNGWEQFHWLGGDALSWGAFTIPYFLCTFLFWNGFVFRDMEVVKVRLYKA